MLSLLSGPPWWEEDLAVLRKKIEGGADVNEVGWKQSTILHAIAGFKEITVFLIDVGSLLISHGADVNRRNSDGLTPLDVTLARDKAGKALSPEYEHLLRQHHAKESRSLPPSLLAADWRDPQVVVGLLEQGADVNEAGYGGHTVLHLMGFERVTEPMRQVARLLIAKGADVNRENGSGSTPCEVAVMRVESGRMPDDEYISILKANGATVRSSRFL